MSINTRREDGRSCASCARGIGTSEHGTKNAKDCFEFILPFFASFATLRQKFRFRMANIEI